MQYWRFDPPVAKYEHGTNDSLGCSITGGMVYRGSRFPQMQGLYFYGDYCLGKIWGLRRAGVDWSVALLQTAPFDITTFGEDEAGDVYVADYGGGVIHRIVDQS